MCLVLCVLVLQKPLKIICIWCFGFSKPYTKTQDNRPHVGPLPIEGAFVHGALSGYGLMASAATSELAALHIMGGKLPEYTGAFHPNRFEDEEYLAKIAEWDDSTQL